MHKAAVGCLVVFGLMILVYLILILIYGCQGSNETWECKLSYHKTMERLKGKIKRVYGLTLKRNPVRSSHVKQLMENLGLNYKVWYGHDAKTEGVKGVCPSNTKRSDGELGCTLSHLAIWKTLRSSQPDSREWFMVFEDDATPALDHKTLMSHMERTIDKAESMGHPLILFGSLPSFVDILSPKTKRIDAYLWKLPCGGLHAYAFQPSILNHMIEQVETNMCKLPVDLILAKRLNITPLVAMRSAFHPLLPFKQFHMKTKGLFGQLRDNGNFSSDIIKQ